MNYDFSPVKLVVNKSDCLLTEQINLYEYERKLLFVVITSVLLYVLLFFCP